MKYFMKYMDDTLIRGSNGDRQPMDIPNLQDVYMLRWQRTKNSIIMCLSSGTVQVWYHSSFKRRKLRSYKMTNYMYNYVISANCK